MNRQLISIGLIVIIVSAIYFPAAAHYNWFPMPKKVMYPDPPSNYTLDYSFIRNMTENLSKIITLNQSGKFLYPKGRAFGTPGEWFAAQMIEENMTNFGLYVSNETIENINFSGNPLQGNLTTKLEVLYKKVKIVNVANTGEDEPPVECFICPRWNWTILESIIPGYDYNEHLLTCNFSYENLEVRPRQNSSWFDKFISNISNTLLAHAPFYDFPSLLGFLVHELETYYNFSFEDAISGNTSSLNWYNNSVINQEFVFIDIDPAFNPDKSPVWRKNFSVFTHLGSMLMLARNIIEMLVWSIRYPGCEGLILYDFNNDTYDMNLRKYMPLPTIYINRTNGEAIMNNITNFRITYCLNQRYNESVKSSNVIGQINGTKPETFIVCSLYDSWWTQGTADSAIGMSIVLGIAKCFAEHHINLSGRETVKFIAFGGEEYGFIGARYYEAKHHDEHIKTVIDVNQVGFRQPRPRLTLNIITNKLPLKHALEEIIGRTEYVERTGNTSNITTWYTLTGAPSNDRPFAINRSLIHPLKHHPYNTETVCFLKDFMWVLHHRDGMNHTEGDVMKYYDPVDVNATAEMILNVTYGLIFRETVVPSILPFLIAMAVIVVAAIIIIVAEKKRRKDTN